MTSDIESILRDAIANRAVLRVRYDRDPSDAPLRIVHPHALYRSRDDNLLVSTFQVDGYSSSGDLPQWREITVAKIRSAEATGDTFSIEPGLNLAHTRYSHDLIVYVRP
jgi:hypothetical protein